MPTFADGELGSSVRGKINAVINAVEQAGLGRNRVVNGGMRIDQRNGGAAQTFTAGAALAYCVDQWYGFCTGANLTGQRVALSNGQHRYRFTGAASVTGVGFGQRIEAANCLDLADGSAMLQVKAYSSSLTSLGWAVYYASTADTFGTLASPTRTLIASGTFTITSTDATYSATLTMPSGAITGLEIVFTGGALLATQTLHIGDVQIEKGTVATTFERRLSTNELILCQRYFAKTYALESAPGAITNNGVIVAQSQSTVNMRQRWQYPTPMRVAPTVLVAYNPATGATASFRNFDASTNGTASLTEFTPLDVCLVVTFSSVGMTTGHLLGTHVVASAVL